MVVPSAPLWTAPLVALSLFPAGAAQAALAPPSGSPVSGRLEVSLDGTHFGRSSDAALFERLGPVFPGKRGTDSAWLRNGTTVPLLVRVQLSNGWSDSEQLAAATTLRVDASGERLTTALGGTTLSGIAGPGAEATAPAGTPAGAACTVVGPTLKLEPGATTRWDASIAVSSGLTGRDGAGARLGFTLRAVAVEASAGFPSPGCSEITADPGLPGPDAPPAPPLAESGWAGGGLGLLGAGLAALGLLLGRRRRHRRQGRTA
jgi:hypothetical protein